MTRLFSRDPFTNPEHLIRRVYAYAAYRLGDGADAEDVTSETFERALRYRSSYDRSKGEPIGWLLGIARRCVDTTLKAHAAERTIANDAELSDGRSLEDESVDRLSLASAVAQLGQRDQELIALRFGGDLTAAQIASVLNLKTNAVEVALHRALNRLRAIVHQPSAAEGGPPSTASDAQAALSRARAASETG